MVTRKKEFKPPLMQLKLCVYQYLMAARLMSHQSGSRVRMHMADLTPRLGNHTSRLQEIPQSPREEISQ